MLVEAEKYLPGGKNLKLADVVAIPMGGCMPLCQHFIDSHAYQGILPANGGGGGVERHFEGGDDRSEVRVRTKNVMDDMQLWSIFYRFQKDLRET